MVICNYFILTTTSDLRLTPHIRSVIDSAPAPVKVKKDKPSVVICRWFRIRMRTPEASLAVISMLVCCLETGEPCRSGGVEVGGVEV